MRLSLCGDTVLSAVLPRTHHVNVIATNLNGIHGKQSAGQPPEIEGKLATNVPSDIFAKHLALGFARFRLFFATIKNAKGPLLVDVR